MTAYNGHAITYDEIGNPLSYYNGSSYTFTWDGRKLASVEKGLIYATFAYNDEGLRVRKTVEGETTTYLYDGNVLIAEYAPNYTCVYIYDESGAIIGAKYISTTAGSSWQTYFFEKNLQGDVIAVYSDTGTKLVSYLYDAWGNVTTTYHNGGASTLAANNPIRYRGYYYDTDLQMYYLQSRYYDAKICRFINADSYVSTGQGILGNNMFAYCGNNPIMLIDFTGDRAMPFWELTWPGEIHQEIQDYLKKHHEYLTEVTVEGKRIDLVKDNNAYEIKPFTVPLFIALLQLLNYVTLSNGDYTLGKYSPELTGSFVSKHGFIVKYYYMGCGVIQYSFYRNGNLIEQTVADLEKEENYSSVGNAIVVGSMVALVGMALYSLNFGGSATRCREKMYLELLVP